MKASQVGTGLIGVKSVKFSTRELLNALSVNVVVDYHVQTFDILGNDTVSSTTWVSKRTVTVGSDQAVLC